MADLDLELLASIASGGLGSWQEDAQGHTVYVKSEDCIGCLRDLQRFFRYDDPEARPAFFAVSRYGFARSDLVPLIVTYPDDYDVVYNALKVATFLTMPSPEPLVTSNRTQQEEHMQAVREAFLAQDALAAVVGMLAEPLGRHPRMNEQDTALVQLVIAFLKNLVAIPAAATAGGGGAAGTAGRDAARRIQAGLLDRLFSDNVADLLLLLAQHSRQRPFRSEAPVLVEIFMHLFCGVDPQLLLDAPHLLEIEQRRRRQEEADAAEKKRRAAAAAAAEAHGAARRVVPGSRGAPAATTSHLPRLPTLPTLRPLAPRAAMPRQMAQGAPSRHPHSGAVYVRRHTEHSAAVVLRHNPHRSELPRLPAVTDAKKAPAQRRDGDGGGSGAGAGSGAGLPLSPELLVRLDGLLGQFLEGSYDLLMTQVFKELEPGLNISRLAEADFMHFVRLATYCTRYVRMREERKLQQMLGEKGAAPAQAAPPGSGSAQQGSPAGSSPDEQQSQQEGQEGQEGQDANSHGQEGEPRGGDAAEAASPFAAISATMGWDCFHWVTMLWIMLSNVEGGARQKDHSDKNWDLQHASVPLLKEMLLALDLARVAGSAADRRAADRLQRRLLHDDLKESGLLPVLSRLIRGYNFRFQPRSHAVDLVEALHAVLGMLDRLAAAEPGGFRVKAVVRKASAGRRRKPAASPAADVDGDADAEQLGGGRGEGSAGPAGGPEGDEGGNQEGTGGQEGGEGGHQAAAAAGSDGESGGDAELAQRVGRSGDPLDEMEDEVAAAAARRATREVAFQAAHRLRQELAHPAIVHFYAWLLQGYRTNAPFTNHALLGLFRRLADPQQLNLEPMLYQLSILRLFESVLSDTAIRHSPRNADLRAFATRLVRNLFARMMPDLSELQQAAGEVGTNLEGRFAAAEGVAAEGDAAGGDADDEADSAEREAARARRRAAAELKARQLAADGLFVELLFWKGPNVADDVRNEYNWRGVVDPAEFQRRGGRHGRRAALGDDDASDGGEGRRFFESHRPRRELFSEEEAALLRAEFEKRNGRKDCLAALVFELGGKWKKGQIAKQLRAMGLQRGKFTAAQEERMRELLGEGRGRVDCFERIADELAAGFSANQVKRHLRKLGAVAGARGGGSVVPPEQESRLRDLYGEHAARQDSFRLVAEGLGGDWTARRVKRHLQKLGVVAKLGKSRQERQRDAAFDALAADSDSQGSDGGSARSAGGDSGSESDAGSGSGFGSERSELKDGSDSEGGNGNHDAKPAAARGHAAGRAAALARLQAKHKGRALRRAASPELGGHYSDDGDEVGDEGRESGDAIAAQQEAAASPASSGGGSFVSLEGSSDNEGGAGTATSGGEPPADKKRKRAGASAGGPAAAAAAAAGPKAEGLDAGSGDIDDGGSGFESARESEPDSEPESAPAQLPTKHKRRRSAPPASGKQLLRKKAQRQRPADRGTPGGKRKAEEPAAGPSSAQKRAALEALRRRRHPAAGLPPAVAAATEPLTDGPADLELQLGPPGSSSPAAKENSAPRQGAGADALAAKPAGRRIVRAGGGTAAVAATPDVPGLEDLEDDV